MTTRRGPVIGSLAALAAALCLVLAACGGSPSGDATGADPHQALAAAKAKFDKASSVHLTLATGSKPKSGNGVLSADGVLTHQPAFKGDVRASINGLEAKVPVVSVDGKVHAQLPLTSSYAVIDPAEYGVPDPASFADPKTGISTLVSDLQGAKEAGRERHGSQLLTGYTGTLPGKKVKSIIPSASAAGSFATTIGLDSAGRVATVKITGPFFAGQGDVTYDLTFDSYDAGVKVGAP